MRTRALLDLANLGLGQPFVQVDSFASTLYTLFSSKYARQVKKISAMSAWAERARSDSSAYATRVGDGNPRLLFLKMSSLRWSCYQIKKTTSQ